jgi:hypothetical protein
MLHKQSVHQTWFRNTVIPTMSRSQLHPLGYESKVAHLSTGHYYRYVDVDPPEGVKHIATALLLHGFPDSA